MSQARDVPSSRSDYAGLVRSALSNVVRLQTEVYKPINQFTETVDHEGDKRYYVQFDDKPPKVIKGLRYDRLAKLKLPDATIQGRVLALSAAVWGLKDCLEQYSEATRQIIDLTAFASRSAHLMVAADLATLNKHGKPGSRSQLNPFLDRVTFDTSCSGPIEYFHDSETKRKELIVTNPTPISYSVKVLVKDGKTTCGDARDLLGTAFSEWLRVVEQLKVLEGEDTETKVLRMILFED